MERFGDSCHQVVIPTGTANFSAPNANSMNFPYRRTKWQYKARDGERNSFQKSLGTQILE